MPLVSFDTPWKHQKTFVFSDVFRGYRKRPVAWNGLRRPGNALVFLSVKKMESKVIEIQFYAFKEDWWWILFFDSVAGTV